VSHELDAIVRFRGGKWKTMRVIESAPGDAAP
jgi:hypothetical protein